MIKLKYDSIYRLSTQYMNEPNIKDRPVLILSSDNHNVLFFKITTKAGREHQRKYRPAILNWRNSGLSRPSYTAIDVPAFEVDRNIFDNAEYLGELSEVDMLHFEIHMKALGY